MTTAPTFSVVAQQERAANLIGLTLGVLALGIGLAALLLLCDIAFPTLVARARRNAQHMPWRSLLVGLINLSFFGLLAIALLSGDEGSRVLGLIVATVLLSFVALGLAAVAQLLGERLRPGDPSTTRRLLAGAATLELAALVPLVGWFAVPALAGLLGYGAVVIALVRRRPSNASEAPRTENQEPWDVQRDL
jgi:ABC-type transport system involved in cytochrome c biogenesis permease subunit